MNGEYFFSVPLRDINSIWMVSSAVIPFGGMFYPQLSWWNVLSWLYFGSFYFLWIEFHCFKIRVVQGCDHLNTWN